MKELEQAMIDVDGYIYEYIPSIYHADHGYMVWKQLGENIFKVSKYKHLSFEDRTWEDVKSLEAFCLTNNLNTVTATEMLMQSLFTKRKFCENTIDIIENVIPAEALREMDIQWTDFQKNFIDMVTKTIKKSKFKVIE